MLPSGWHPRIPLAWASTKSTNTVDMQARKKENKKERTRGLLRGRKKGEGQQEGEEGTMDQAGPSNTKVRTRTHVHKYTRDYFLFFSVKGHLWWPYSTI